ncbi:MAG: WecB/TagA/CpsF family glycosyltransferase [Anaerolineales bacterium]|nr:WecB/TagA/CpsF family glycosyltransferase [Anaerolineales bacterium]
MKPSNDSRSIFGIEIHAWNYTQAVAQVVTWAREGQSRCIYATSVHGLIEAMDHADFAEVLQQADMITPDGMPLVWVLRLKGYREQERVYGPTLTLHLLAAAAQAGLPVGFFGSRPEVLDALSARMRDRFPGLEIAYRCSPPFRDLSAQEDAAIVEAINSTGLRILFIGLGCPKQERWINAHRGTISAAMVAVGAAFDFHAGTKRQAPAWMQGMGLEWLFRLFQEPGRLWRRYFYITPRFILLSIAELLALRRKP